MVIEPLLPNKPRGVPRVDDRRVINGILWRFRTGKSRILECGESTSAERAAIKKLVAEREIALVVATDAACEGLNVQTLGTLINSNLPWNQSKLEQRIGRIKRLAQTRERVDMANLTYVGTVDEKVYRVLSERLKTTYNLLETMPETIDADWIKDRGSVQQEGCSASNNRYPAGERCIQTCRHFHRHIWRTFLSSLEQQR